LGEQRWSNPNHGRFSGDAEIRLRDAASRRSWSKFTLLKAIEARHGYKSERGTDRNWKCCGNRAMPMQLNLLRGTGFANTGTFPRCKPLSDQHKLAQLHNLHPKLRSNSRGKPKSVNRPTHQTNLDLPQIWSELVEAVGRASPFTRSYLLEAHPVSITKTLFTIGFDPEFEDHMSLVDNSKNHAPASNQAGGTRVGPNIQIKFIKAETPGSLFH
jgi:hypothetical protein